MHSHWLLTGAGRLARQCVVALSRVLAEHASNSRSDIVLVARLAALGCVAAMIVAAATYTVLIRIAKRAASKLLVSDSPLLTTIGALRVVHGNVACLNLMVDVEHLACWLTVDTVAATGLWQLVPAASLGVLDEEVVAGAFFQQPAAYFKSVLLDLLLELVLQTTLVDAITIHFRAHCASVLLKVVHAVTSSLFQFFDVLNLPLVAHNLSLDFIELAVHESLSGAHIADG